MIKRIMKMITQIKTKKSTERIKKYFTFLCKIIKKIYFIDSKEKKNVNKNKNKNKNREQQRVTTYILFGFIIMIRTFVLKIINIIDVIKVKKRMSK